MLTWLEDDDKRRELAGLIYSKARALGDAIIELKGGAELIQPEHVLVDFPRDKVVGGSEPLIRTPLGQVTLPDLYFKPEMWSQAYAARKRCGYVFTPEKFVGLVALAARIVVYDEFDVVVTGGVDRQCKTEAMAERMVRDGWVTKATMAGLCKKDFYKKVDRPILVPIRREDVYLPETWQEEAPELALRISEAMGDCLPSGMLPSERSDVMDTVMDLCKFVDSIESSGDFVKRDKLDEKKDLQSELLKHLRARDVAVREGEELAGGETDLIVRERIVIECKKRGIERDPLNAGPDFAWQARRYALSLWKRVVFVVLAYRPADERGILPKTSRIQIKSLAGDDEEMAEIRVVIPLGYNVPSRAKHPGG